MEVGKHSEGSDWRLLARSLQLANLGYTESTTYEEHRITYLSLLIHKDSVIAGADSRIKSE